MRNKTETLDSNKPSRMVIQVGAHTYPIRTKKSHLKGDNVYYKGKQKI